MINIFNGQVSVCILKLLEILVRYSVDYKRSFVYIKLEFINEAANSFCREYTFLSRIANDKQKVDFMSCSPA